MRKGGLAESDDAMRLPQAFIDRINTLPTTSVGFVIFVLSYGSHWIFQWPDSETCGFLFVLVLLDGFAKEVHQIGDELSAIGSLLGESTESSAPFGPYRAHASGRRNLDVRVCGFYIVMAVLLLRTWYLPNRRLLDTLYLVGCWLFFVFANSASYILAGLRAIREALHKAVLK